MNAEAQRTKRQMQEKKTRVLLFSSCIDLFFLCASAFNSASSKTNPPIDSIRPNSTNLDRIRPFSTDFDRARTQKCENEPTVPQITCRFARSPSDYLVFQQRRTR